MGRDFCMNPPVESPKERAERVERSATIVLTKLCTALEREGKMSEQMIELRSWWHTEQAHHTSEQKRRKEQAAYEAKKLRQDAEIMLAKAQRLEEGDD